jgi:ATP-binding cassette subfamily F protein 3
MYRSPSEFSGGYQIRINLARLLVSQPDMLLLDEPNNYLDIVAIRWLEEFLRAWKGEFMLITHDRSFMDRVATHTVAIHRTKARKVEGDTEKLYAQIAQEEEIYEKTRLNEEKKRRQTELFIARFKARASFASRAQSRVKMLEKQGVKKALENIEDLELYFNSAHFAADKMMAAEHVSFSYTGSEPYLINDFSIDIGKRDRVCIVGKNGKGKSTLLKLLAGELQPLTGTITKHPVLQEGYFGQTNKLQLDETKTITEEIMSADKKCSENKARTIAGGLMFPDDAALKKIKVLSGGEKVRCMLSRMMIFGANVLVMDQPTNHLDLESITAVNNGLMDFKGILLFSSHDHEFILTIATRIIELKGETYIDKISTFDEYLEYSKTFV